MLKGLSKCSDFIAPTVVIVCHSNGMISQCSSQLSEVFGYGGDDLVGRSIDLLFPRFDNEKLCIQSRSDLFVKENIMVEGHFQAQHEDKSKIPVFVTELVIKDDEGVKVIITVQSLSAPSNSHLLYLKLEEKLYQAQKLEAIGLLTCNIVHDLNNMLYVILSNTESLLLESNAGILDSERLESIKKATLHITELTKQALIYSAESEVNKSIVDVSEVVKEMQILLQTSFGMSINVSYDLMDNVPAISAIPGQIKQIILNFITNACDSIGDEKGGIQITTGTVNIHEEQFDFANNEMLPFGNYVFIQAADDGNGVEANSLVEIFEPFYSTKKMAGRGLGLYSVLGIVKEHDGAITIESSLGKGAKFTALFPIHNEGFLELTDYVLPEKSPTFDFVLAWDE